MQAGKMFLEEFLEYLNESLIDIEQLESENPDFVLIHELASQLKEEVETLLQDD